MSLFGKGKKLYSVFNFKCPQCHETDMYKTGTFSFQKPFEMKAHCEHCQLNYMPEPGFYYGAMFISYIIMGWFCVGFAAFFRWGMGWSLESSFLLLIAVCALFFVYIFRLARSIWININVKYDPRYRRTQPKAQ